MKLSVALLSLAALVSAVPDNAAAQSTTCDSTVYSTNAVKDASDAACKHLKDKTAVNNYPHPYKNHEGFEFKGLPAPYHEFPILPSGSIYNSGSKSPGPDRVIITKDCRQAGQITHTGASGNNFKACSGTS